MSKKYISFFRDNFGAAIGIYIAIALSYLAIFELERLLRWQVLLSIVAVTFGAVFLNKYMDSRRKSDETPQSTGNKYKVSEYVVAILFLFGALLLLSII